MTEKNSLDDNPDDQIGELEVDDEENASDEDLEEQIEELQIDEEETASDDDIEDSIEELEQQGDNIGIDDVADRMEKIENQQRQLQTQIENLVEQSRNEGKVTPHVDSVEELYHDLQSMKSDMSALQEQVDDLVAGSDAE